MWGDMLDDAHPENAGYMKLKREADPPCGTNTTPLDGSACAVIFFWKCLLLEVLSQIKFYLQYTSITIQSLGRRCDICTGVWHVRYPIRQLISSGNQMDKVDGQLICLQILDFPSTMVFLTMTEWPLNKCTQLLMVKRCVVASMCLIRSVGHVWPSCPTHSLQIQN